MRVSATNRGEARNYCSRVTSWMGSFTGLQLRFKPIHRWRFQPRPRYAGRLRWFRAMEPYGEGNSVKLLPSFLKAGPPRCRRKFLRYFRDGFQSEKYVAWERGYKWTAHEQWEAVLASGPMTALLRHGRYRRDRGPRGADRVANEPAVFLREDGAAGCGEIADSGRAGLRRDCMRSFMARARTSSGSTPGAPSSRTCPAARRAC